MSGEVEGVEAWRESREPRWYYDIGYKMQDELLRHRFEINDHGEKPDDPGWHVCSCGGWEGYWCDWQPHVTDGLRALVVAREDALRRSAVEAATRAWQMGGWTVLTEALKTTGIPALACGQAATDWLRTYAAETYPSSEGADQ